MGERERGEKKGGERERERGKAGSTEEKKRVVFNSFD